MSLTPCVRHQKLSRPQTRIVGSLSEGRGAQPNIDAYPKGGVIRHVPLEGGEEKHGQLSKGRSKGQIENPREPSSHDQGVWHRIVRHQQRWLLRPHLSDAGLEPSRGTTGAPVLTK